MVTFESPIQWIPQQARTKSPKRSGFGSHSISYAGGLLSDELRMLGAKNCVVSSNLRVKINGGGFYSNQRVEDVGVVIYFELKGVGKAMACDKWNKVEHNLWALYLTVKSIRGIERWGGSEILEGLFTGFAALPAPGEAMIVTTQYFTSVDNLEDLKILYKNRCKKLHPDFGGDPNEFIEMNRQYKQKLESLQ